MWQKGSDRNRNAKGCQSSVEPKTIVPPLHGCDLQRGTYSRKRGLRGVYQN
jgi:hypothetical protein